MKICCQRIKIGKISNKHLLITKMHHDTNINKYKQEKEWRIIKNEDLPKYKMVDNKHLVPYMEVKILIDCIKKIVVGPCLSSKETVRNVKSYLLSKHLDIENIEVVESEIPYRNRF